MLLWTFPSSENPKAAEHLRFALCVAAHVSVAARRLVAARLQALCVQRCRASVFWCSPRFRSISLSSEQSRRCVLGTVCQRWTRKSPWTGECAALPRALTGLCPAGGHHGPLPHDRTVLPGKFRQHRASLHDAEGKIGDCRQNCLILTPWKKTV